MSSRWFLLTGCAALVTSTCLSESRIADIRQGTNIAVALSPNGTTLVVDLIGQIWQLPLGGGAANPLTPVSTIARNPRFSPDGNTIVYQSENAGQWDLWLHDVRGNTQRQLTDTPHNETEPDFSRDGRFVVFSSDLAGTYDIWEIGINSGELRQLTRSPGNTSSPSVSERGEIAYVDERNGDWSLELLREGVITRLLTKPYPLRAPSWRPGGGVIVFNEQPTDTQSNLVMLLLDTDLLTRTLTHGEDVFGFRPAWISPGEFVYTADGQLWRRHLASTTRQAVQLFAGVAVDRASYPRRSIVADDTGPSAPVEPYVIQVDRLFDGIRNQYRRHMDIHVEGGRIAAVVARGLRPLPARVVDARGYTLIPGLIDLHAHPIDLPQDRLGRLWLAFGVTTVRELGNDWEGWVESLDRKAAWASDIPGPRLLLTAPAPDEVGIAPDGPESEFDVFQLYRGRPEQLTTNTIRQVREMGVPIFGQALFPAARFGIDGLEHIGGRGEQPFGLERSALGSSYQDVFSVLIETRTVVTPTLAAFGGFEALLESNPMWARDPAYLQLFSAAERARWEAEPMRHDQLDALQRMIARLVRAGGRIAAGSDSPTVPVGFGLHAELALLSGIGIPTDQVLRLATAEAALALGLDRDLGTLEPGKLADFVVLSGNPLLRIEDSLRIEAVVKGGVWMDRQELLAKP